MSRRWTLFLTAFFGFLLALVGQQAAQAASGDGVITGTITAQSGGAPIANASIAVYKADQQWGGSSYYGYTSANGTFTLNNVADGDYKIQITSPYNSLYLGEWYDDKASFDAATPVTVSNGSTVTASASLATGGRLTGTITADQGGAPIDGAYVYVYDTNSNSNSYSSWGYGYAGADGTFTTSAVPPGTYKVQIYAPYQSMFLGEWYDNKSSMDTATPVTVTANADTTVNAKLARGSRIKGTVTAQTGGQALSSVYVSVDGAGGYSSSAYGNTDANGNYVTGALPPGNYKVQFSPGYQSDYLSEWFDNKDSFDSATPVTLTSGQDAIADAKLAKGSHITGQVTDPDGQGVQASIRVEGRYDSWTEYSAADGSYDVGGLRAGRYTVRFTPTAPTELVREWWNDQREQDLATPIVLGSETTFTANAELERGGVVTGRVTDPQDQPVVGATVRVRGTQGGGMTAVTDGNGIYRVAGLEAGDYRVRVKPFGNLAGQWYQAVDTADEAALVRVGLGETMSGVDAQLRLARTISGAVLDPDDNPVPDVRVQVYARGANYYTDTVLTDALGQFTTHDLPVGTYQIFVRPSSPTTYASQWYDGAASRAGATSVVVTQGNSPSITARLKAGGTITGNVTQVGGAPVTDAYVEAYNDGEYRYAETDLQGNYEITGLTSGDYTVWFWSSGNGLVSEYYDDAVLSEDAQPVPVVTGQNTPGIDAQLAKAASISGTVRAGGTPVPQYTDVELYRDGEYWDDAYTNSQGQYSFTGLLPGQYKMRVSGSGDYASQWWNGAFAEASATVIVLASGQDLTGRDFALVKGASIAGTIRDTNGNAVSNASVSAYDESGRWVGYAGVTQGAYRVAGLPPGSYRLSFDAGGPDLLSEWWNDRPTLTDATPITVTAAQQVTGIDPVLAKASKIRGTVLDGQGDPVEACVSVYRQVDDEELDGACTDSDGSYVVGGLPAGNYLVRFRANGGQFATQWWNNAPRRAAASVINVQPGAEVVANATMLRGGTLTGLVTDQDDKPVGGVQMRAYAPDRGYEYAVSDSLGRYTFRGLDDDDYRIEAIPGSGRLDLLREWYNDKASYDTATVVPVGNGKTVTADFALEQGALVSGVVTDDGGPVAGIGVDVFDLNGNKSLTAWTNAEGKYMSSALPAGEYKVRFMPGYYGGDGLVEQWWEDRTTEANAKIIYLSAKEHKTGVDARLRPIGNATVPGAPTGVTASAGDEQVILQWQAPVNNGGLAITRYRVEGVPDGGCQTLGKLSCVIEDLDNGQSYQFTVRASNSAGLSLQSTASAAVVPFGKPKPPTAVIATAGVESAAVSWTPGNANGRPITSYTVTSAPGGKTCTTGTTSCTVAGLTGGTAYTFTVRARNDAGDSAASDASAPVTPGGPVAPPAGPPAAGGTGGGVGATPPPSGGAIPPVTAAPSAPSKVKTSVKKRKLRASWASSPTATSYKVRISPAKKPTKGTWKTVSKPSYSSGKLKKGKYVLQVKALGPGGESPVAKITIRVK